MCMAGTTVRSQTWVIQVVHGIGVLTVTLATAQVTCMISRFKGQAMVIARYIVPAGGVMTGVTLSAGIMRTRGSRCNRAVMTA